MTRAEYVERWRDELAGPILDLVCSDASGGERSQRVQRMYRKIGEVLGQQFDAFSAAMTKAPANGTPLTTRK